MDPLSTAASVLSVASIGIQITQSIHSLIRFCKSVRDAPEALQTVSEDLSLLDEILNSFMMHYRASHGSDDLAAAQSPPAALTVCLARLQRLVRMTSKLERGLARSRSWGGLKVALKEDSLSKFQDSLERTKTSLLLLCQVQFNELVVRHRLANLVLNSANETVATTSASFPQASKPPDEILNTGTGSSPCLTNRQDRVGNTDTQEAAGRPEQRPPSYSLIPRRPVSIYTQRRLRERRVVPRNSDVMSFAKQGNVEQLWSLIDQGFGSPFDVTVDGWTPLHYAARSAHPLTCKFLVDLGADCNAIANSAYAPLSLVSTDQLHTRRRSVKHIVDLTRMLLENGNADPDLEIEPGIPVYYTYEGNIDGIKLFINQADAVSGIASRSANGWGVLHEQLWFAGLCRHRDKYVLERLRFWVSRGADVNARLDCSSDLGFPRGAPPLHVACSNRHRPPHEHWPPLILQPGLLELFLHADADLHAVDDDGYTIMRKIDEDHYEADMVNFFNLLDHLDVDILEYMESEIAIHESNGFDPLEIWRKSYASAACSYRTPHLDMLCRGR